MNYNNSNTAKLDAKIKQLRHKSLNKLKSKWNEIYEKYEKFKDEQDCDIIDLETGQVVEEYDGSADKICDLLQLGAKDFVHKDCEFLAAVKMLQEDITKEEKEQKKELKYKQLILEKKDDEIFSLIGTLRKK